MRSWTTASSPGGSSVTYWREAICEAIFELDFASADHAMTAQLHQHDLGALKLSDVAIGSAHQVSRSRQAAARDKAAHFNLNFVKAGRWSVDHYGRQVDVGAGELVLLDSRQAYTVSALAGTVHVSAHLPVDWLRCWLPNPEEAVARPIGAESPWYRMLTATLDEIVSLHPEESAVRAMCAQQIGGALALGLGGATQSRPSNAQSIYRRIIGVIRERFHDAALDAAAVAGAVQISQRYLHKILAQEGTTYVRELFAVRLDQARAMLENPLFAELSIAEIGWRCGFCDPSHFSRRFKDRFGGSPGACRTRGAVPEAALLH